jgi:hypothetical protein
MSPLIYPETASRKGLNPQASMRCGIVIGVVGQSKSGTMLEALHQQTETVHRREAFGTDDLGQAAGTRPSETCIEQSLRGFGVILTFEKIEEGCRFVVELVVGTVVQDGEPANGTIPLVGEKKYGVGMFVEREPLRVKSEAFVHLQGRHPLGNVPIDEKRQMEEIPQMGFVGEIDLGDVHGKL